MKCKIKQCDREAVCRGWCSMHYDRWLKHGSPHDAGHRYHFTKKDRQKAKAKVSRYRAIDPSLYYIWGGMKARCYCPTNKDYHNYGARGITVCDRWLGEKGYEHFCKDMGKRPGPNYSIDRIDGAKGYSPDNCRWATPREQILNTRSIVWVEYNGEITSMLDFSKKVGVPNATTWWRYRHNKEIYPGAKVVERSF